MELSNTHFPHSTELYLRSPGPVASADSGLRQRTAMNRSKENPAQCGRWIVRCSLKRDESMISLFGISFGTRGAG